MSKESQVTIGVTVSGDGETNTFTPSACPITNTSAPNGGGVPWALTAAYCTTTPPTGAVGVVIVPPTTSTNAKTLKGVTGDTGIPLRANAPTVLSLAGTTIFGVLSAGVETVMLHWF